MGLLAPGCVVGDDDGTGTGAAPHAAIVRAAATVGSYTGAPNCSTAVVMGLVKQIIKEADCANPSSFVSFQGAAGVTLADSSVIPYLVKDARDDLKTVAASNSLVITSALRTLADQYLLYQWYLQGRCGITAAATVGTSNHEGGRAVDMSNYSSRVTAMAAHGWEHDVPGDPVHFDHTASVDDRTQDTHAFQMLWNLNHPDDQITVDGIYGPQTEARLVESPAAGFAQGTTCGTGSGSGNDGSAADLVSVMGPTEAPPATLEHYTLIVKNTGTTGWPAGTLLEIAGGSASPLYDSSWQSETEIVALPDVIGSNAQVSIDFDVMTPDVTVSTPIMQELALVAGSTTYGTFQLALTVTPDDNGSGSANGSGGGDPDQGGCSAGGRGGSGFGFAVALAALAFRRRRAST